MNHCQFNITTGECLAKDGGGQVNLLPQYRHRMALSRMGSAQNGHGIMGASCAVLAGFGLAGAGLAGGWTVGRIRIQMKEKSPNRSPISTHPTTLRFLLDATTPQKTGQKMNQNRAATISMELLR